MFQTAILASGSKGNSILIRTAETKILLDAGLSGKKISQSFQELGVEENKIKALIISHEHSDHVGGAGVICRKYQIPLFITKPTYDTIQHRVGKTPAGVAKTAKKLKLPVIALCGCLGDGVHDVIKIGIDSYYSTLEFSITDEEVPLYGPAMLENCAEQVGRTIAIGRMIK